MKLELTKGIRIYAGVGQLATEEKEKEDGASLSETRFKFAPPLKRPFGS